MIDVLSVASEVHPLVKTGGLADVTGALPAALKPHGVTMRVLMPGYPAVMEALGKPRELATVASLFGGPARIVGGRAAGLRIIAIDAPHLFERKGGPYANPGGADWPDNWRRFAALGWTGAAIAEGLVAGYAPQIVHVHDWQAGLAPVYMRYTGTGRARSVVTIHNLAFQGQFPAAIFSELDLPAAAFAIDGVEYHGGVGFLKGALTSADLVTTVSPTYAREIRDPDFGMGLEGVLASRADTLVGITNGIDTAEWNPETDTALAANYTAARIARRADNKKALEARFRLEPGKGPLMATVSRLTWQKGSDLLAAVSDILVQAGGRLAVLGAGDAGIEADLNAVAARHPGQVGVVLGHDEALAHLIQAGADAIVLPSRYEPCGLTQLCAQRYGCVPIASRVGGLNDTIVDANDAALDAGSATGIMFAPVSAPSLAEALGRAMRLYGERARWRKIQRRGMKADVSWSRSAGRYARLYAQLAKSGSAR